MDEYDRIKALLVDRHGGLTIEEIAKSLSISRITATKYLNALLSGGQVQKRVCGPARIFTLTKRVPIYQFINLIFHPAVLIDQDLFIKQVNDPLIYLLSVTKNDLLDTRIEFSPLMTFFSFSLLNEIKMVFSDGNERQREEPIEVHDKKMFYRLRFIPVCFESGDSGIVVIFEDITELREYQDRLILLVRERTQELEDTNHRLNIEIEKQKLLKRHLAENQKLYSNLVENAQVIIIELNSTGKIRFCNEYTQFLMKTPLSALIGKSFINTIIPANSLASKDFLDIIQRVSSEQLSNESIQTEMEFPEGKKWIKWTFRSVLKKSHSKKNLLVIGTDITPTMEAQIKIKESENLLLTIITHLPDPTFVIDRERNVIFWNHAMENMTGISSADIVGKGRDVYPMLIYKYKRPVLADLIFEPENPEILTHFNDVKMDNGTIIAETIADKPNGKTRRYWVKATPLYDSNNTVIGAIQSLRDITDYPV